MKFYKATVGIYLVVPILVIWASQTWASPAIVVTRTTLLAQPDFSAPVISTLKAASKVESITRRGGWKKIKVGAKTGWVRGYQVREIELSTRRITTRSSTSGGFFAALANLSRKASGLFSNLDSGGITSNATATIGIRGRGLKQNQATLNSTLFSRTEADLTALNKIKSWRSSINDAKRFAAQGKRSKQSVKQLPDAEAAK